MRLSEAFVAVTLAAAACKPGEVDFDNSGNLPDYVAPDTGDSADTAVDTDTDTSADTDTAEPSETGDTAVPTEQLITTTVADCTTRLLNTSIVDDGEFVAQDNFTGEPSMDTSYQVTDHFGATLNPEHPSADFQDVFACARLTPTDGSAEQILGADTTRDLNTQKITVILDPLAPETASLVVWIGTQNADASVRGFTTPDAHNDNTARTYTISQQGGVYRVSDFR
jgi:hypothetical protein